MRIIFLVLAIIILILATSIWGYYLLKEQAETILGLLDDLKEETYAGNWSRGEEIKEQLRERWKRASTIFPVMIDHAEFHDLSLSLTRIFTLIEIKEERLLLPEIDVARRLIQEIPEQEKLSLENIF